MVRGGRLVPLCRQERGDVITEFKRQPVYLIEASKPNWVWSMSRFESPINLEMIVRTQIDEELNKNFWKFDEKVLDKDL